MADARACEQCGTQFTPRREHSRFCSADCRRAWNKEHVGTSSVSPAALDWSLSAMAEATGRLGRARTVDPRHAAVAVSDVELVPVGEKQFLFLVSHGPRFALNVLRVMARRLRASNRSM